MTDYQDFIHLQTYDLTLSVVLPFSTFFLDTNNLLPYVLTSLYLCLIYLSGVHNYHHY